MGIKFDEQKKQFTLTTKTTSYQMMVDAYGFLLHIYYGDRYKKRRRKVWELSLTNRKNSLL